MDKGTVVRTVIFAITWLNLFLASKGLQPIPVLDEATVALGLTLIASVWAWFKNNYVTIKGQAQKEELKKKGLA